MKVILNIIQIKYFIQIIKYQNINLFTENTTINSNQQINPFIVPKIKKLNFKVIKLNNSNSKDMKYKKLDKKK